jgi:hypothetical protein
MRHFSPSPQVNLSLDSKSETSHDLSPTSQLVGPQVQLVVSLRVVDSQVATCQQVARQVAKS